MQSYDRFVSQVASTLEGLGWTLTMPSAVEHSLGLDRVGIWQGLPYALQFKDQRRRVAYPQVERFLDLLLDPQMAQFQRRGVLISAQGFSATAMTLVNERTDVSVQLGLWQAGQIRWMGEIPGDLQVAQTQGKTYVGVFTCKGGVGKTTVSAHLAGAFALTGYDVALLDLDPQQNLSTLLSGRLWVQGNRSHSPRQLTVYSPQTWDEQRVQERVILCDCSPDFDNNPPELMARLDYCLIPTTLNPLGFNKNGHIIRSTLRQIRQLNPHAQLLVLINNDHEDNTQRRRVLKEQYRQLFAELEQQDAKFQFIDPDECSIRNSRMLFYWGHHLFTGEPGELAFTAVGGRCVPKEDFLNLLDYLERVTQVDRSKPG